MSDFKNSLAYLISNQVPDYIRAEFPQFVLFLEKYYEFLDQDGEANNVLLNASSFSDVNNTLDAFIPSFREQYLQMFPKDSLITDRRLIKFIREFYEAKGSEESILFIFRTFFNEHVDIIYPSTYVLKASDGVWINREKMRITIDDTISLDPFELKGKRAKIYSHIDIGSVSTFETHGITVEEVTRLAYSTVPTYELYVKHEENDVITLPGAGANARPLVVDGKIKAITGDPLFSSNYFDPAENFDIYARILIPDHGYTTGDCVVYDPMAGTSIGGLIPYRQYFIKAIDSKFIQIYPDKISLQQVPNKKFFASSDVNTANNTITMASHGYITGDMIVYRADSTAVGGLEDSGVYYVIKIDNNTIKLAESLIDSDPRYCSDDTYFAEDYVTITSYNELDLTSAGVGNYHVISKEYFINFTSAGTGAQQRFIDAMDAPGSGYKAIPDVTFISDIGGTGATAQAYLNDTGGIEYVSMLSNGTGYEEESTIVSFSTDTIRSFVYIDGFTNKYGYVSRSITDTVGIVSVSGTPNYGFLPGEVYSISESGSTGQYVFNFPDPSLNYFAGDYVKFGMDNRASVIIDAVDAQGKPTKVRIFSTGSGFEAETFTSTITSSSGSNCVLQFTTGAITSIQEGFQNRQGMLSDVNHLQDNYYYQNYSYVLRSKVPSANWMTMVKNTVHPAGMAVFSELLVRNTLELGASFEVVRQPIHFYEFPVENLHAVEDIGIDYQVAVEFVKILEDTYLATDEYVSHVYKVLDDNSNGFSELVTNFVGKNVIDAPVTSDSINSDFSKTLLDIPLASDEISFGSGKVIAESTMGMADSSVSHFYKYLDKTTDTAAPYILGDYFAEDYLTSADIILSASDTTLIESGKNVADAIAVADSIPYMVITKVINETVTVTENIDSIDPTYTIPYDDPRATDILASSFTKIITDGVNTTDNSIRNSEPVFSDTTYYFEHQHSFHETISIASNSGQEDEILHTNEERDSNVSKVLSETPVISDSGSINIQDYWSENYAAGAYVGTEYSF